MVRINRTYSIEEIFVEKLKKTNASELINSLLDEHFNQEVSEDPREIKKNILENQEKLVVYQQKVNYFEDRLKEVNEKNRKIEERKSQQLLRQQRKKEAEELKEAWISGKLTDEQYWDEIDRRKEEYGS